MLIDEALMASTFDDYRDVLRCPECVRSHQDRTISICDYHTPEAKERRLNEEIRLSNERFYENLRIQEVERERERELERYEYRDCPSYPQSRGISWGSVLVGVAIGWWLL